MKRFLLFLACVLLMSQFHSAANTFPPSQVRCLVVYYTYSGVTRTLAQAIADNCDGELLEVVDHGNYPRPESQTTYTFANNERSQMDAGNWPEINTSVDDFDDWDLVIICTPLWNGKMANPMLTFLHNHAEKLDGKQVALAVTSYSSGYSGVLADARNTLPNSTFVGNTLHITYSNRPKMAEMASQWVPGLEVEVTPNTNKIHVIVGGQTFMATLADNATAQYFKTMLPMTIDMDELNGNEKYHYLSESLPSAPVNPGTIYAGDIMLYGNSCVVLFYQTFNTGYSYTRIGSLDDPTGLAEAVGPDNAMVTFELAYACDVNCDNEVDINDVTDLIAMVLSGSISAYGDVDINGVVDINDVTCLINVLLGVK